MNEPNPAVIRALRMIYASTRPSAIPSICDTIRRYNPKYYATLIKYCPEWEVANKELYHLSSFLSSPAAQPIQTAAVYLNLFSHEP